MSIKKLIKELNCDLEIISLKEGKTIARRVNWEGKEDFTEGETLIKALKNLLVNIKYE